MTTRSSKGKTPVIQNSTGSIMTIGADFGYGNTKAAWNGDQIIFPSVAGHARDVMFNADKNSAKYPGDEITDSYGDWFIGELALKQIPEAQQLMLKGRTANADEQGMAFRLRLMYSTLAKMFPVTHGDALHIRLATGLPVKHMRDASLMKETFIGQHPIRANNANFVANITDVMVMPQPYGTLYSQQLLPNGELDPHYTAIRSAVVDVGRFTVDCALDDNGDFIDAESDSVEAGVHTVQERIAKAMDQDFDKTPNYSQIETVLRTKRFKNGVKTHDYSVEVENAVKPLRDATLALMSRLWGTGMGIDVIYLTGGGGILVEEAVKKAYPQALLIDNAQMSNAIGYLSYARFAARQ